MASPIIGWVMVGLLGYPTPVPLQAYPSKEKCEALVPHNFEGPHVTCQPVVTSGGGPIQPDPQSGPHPL